MTKPPKVTTPPPDAAPPPRRKVGRPRKVTADPAPEPAPRDPNEPDLFAGWIGEEALARQRGLSIHSLRKERKRPDGPPFTRDGRRILYSVQGFRDWLAARETGGGA